MGLNEDAMATMFADHHTALMKYAVRRVGPAAAPDIVADAFAIAFQHRTTPEHPLPWLYAIARNLIRNHARTAARSLRLADPTSSPDLAEGIVERDALVRALRSLPEKSREVLMLVAWEGLEPADAAVVLGCSAAAFRVRLHRARQQLAAAASPPAIDHIAGVTP
jgi:RNA polymerase sigma-70 factor, ECF subfamily